MWLLGCRNNWPVSGRVEHFKTFDSFFTIFFKMLRFEIGQKWIVQTLSHKSTLNNFNISEFIARTSCLKTKIVQIRSKVEGTAEKHTRYDDSRFKQAQLYEWGLRQQCLSTSYGNFSGAYFLLEPVGWFQLGADEREEPILDSRDPLFKKRSNQERGICLPDSCSLEEVMVLMSPMTVEDIIDKSGFLLIYPF